MNLLSRNLKPDAATFVEASLRLTVRALCRAGRFNVQPRNRSRVKIKKYKVTNKSRTEFRPAPNKSPIALPLPVQTNGLPALHKTPCKALRQKLKALQIKHKLL